MASLTLKNIPDSLLDRLRARAVADRRSVSQEMIHLLERSLDAVPAADRDAPTAARAQAEAWTRLAGRWESDQSVEDEIREILASRTAGRDVDL
jgi:plasmid stability protein